THSAFTNLRADFVTAEFCAEVNHSSRTNNKLTGRVRRASTNPEIADRIAGRREVDRLHKTPRQCRGPRHFSRTAQMPRLFGRGKGTPPPGHIQKRTHPKYRF